MKSIFRILSVAIICMTMYPSTAVAGQNDVITQTSLKKQRFEMIQSGLNCSFSLLLDKYTGNTWIFHTEGDRSGWCEIYRQDLNSEGKLITFRVSDKEANENRFRIKMVDGDMTECFLIDTVTHTTYSLIYNKDSGYTFVLCTDDSE